MKKTNALRLLDQRKIIYETVEYEYNEENLSVKKMAGDNFFIADNVFKTLVARGDKNGVLIAVINGNQTLKSALRFSDRLRRSNFIMLIIVVLSLF